MPEKILIVDDDIDTLRLVGLMLQRQGYEVLAANNGHQGLEMGFENIPDLVLLDVMMPGMDGYEVARRLRANQDTTNIPILMFTAKTQLDDKVAGFEAGADDYLTKPVHPTELQAHVKALLVRSSKARQINPPTGPVDAPAHVIGLLSTRGGLGVTTVAANLGSALLLRSNTDVIVAEMCPGQGTLALDLDIPANRDALETVLKTPADKINRQQVRDLLIKHPSGLNLLLAGISPSQASLVEHSAAQFETLVGRLRFMSRFVLLDLGSTLHTVNQKVLGHCNEIILVMEPTQSSLLLTKAMLSDLQAIGIDRRRISLVLNYRLRSDMQLSASQVIERLGMPVALTITPAPELLYQATRKHTTAFLQQPEGLTGQQFISLANAIIERVKHNPVK